MEPETVELNEWEQYEEDGLLDLEDQLDRALDRAFPHPTSDNPHA